jgi:MFS superfamily sulfate permease-like transporter
MGAGKELIKLGKVHKDSKVFWLNKWIGKKFCNEVIQKVIVCSLDSKANFFLLAKFHQNVKYKIQDLKKKVILKVFNCQKWEKR